MTNFLKIKVKLVPKGKTIKVKRLKKGHIPEITKFNFAIVNFGNFFDYVKNKTVPIPKRIKKSTRSFRILSYEYPKIINPALKVITRLANLSNQTAKNSQKRFDYQQALSAIYWPMVQETWKNGIDDTLALLLERGALLIGAFYNYPNNYNVSRIIAKRLEFEDGKFGLGLSNFSFPKNIKKFKKLHIQEDCIATGDSISGVVLSLKERGFVFNEVQIDAVVVAQTGAIFLQEYLKYLGVKKVIIKTGALCFKLDNHFYLRRIRENGYKENEFFVGDMGEWSKILPKKYNKIAWWNKNRSDYK